MKKEITVIIKGYISEEALENYYKQLWIAMKEQCGYETIEELYSEYIKNDENTILI